jgi:DNA-binding CsgD family transcriptional regulator
MHPELNGDDLNCLIAGLYEAANSEDVSWHPIMQGLVRALGARTGWLILRSANADLDILGSVGIGTEAVTAYLNHYVTKDPWAKAAKSLSIGAIFNSQDHFDTDALLRTEFFADWVCPHVGNATWGLGLPLSVVNGSAAQFVVQRLHQAGAFTVKETRVLKQLAPHLRNALVLRHRLGNLVTERNRALNILASVQTSALVFDEFGQIKFISPTAEKLLRAEDGLRTTPNGIQAATTAEQTRLSRAIALAADSAAPKGTMLRLSRPSGASDWVVLIAPFASEAAGSGGREVLCLIRDPNQNMSPAEHHLVSAFGLTGAEARVAGAIAQGKSLEMISSELGVSRNTVRNQAQQVLSKTGAARQAQLVRLILGLPTASN